MHEGGCYVVMCVVEALLPLPHCHLQHCKALTRSQKHGGVQQRARNSSSSAAPRRLAGAASGTHPLCRTAHVAAVPAAMTLPAASLHPKRPQVAGLQAGRQGQQAAGAPQLQQARGGTRRMHASQPSQPAAAGGVRGAVLHAWWIPSAGKSKLEGRGQVLCAGGGPQKQQQHGGSVELWARRGGGAARTRHIPPCTNSADLALPLHPQLPAWYPSAGDTKCWGSLQRGCLPAPAAQAAAGGPPAPAPAPPTHLTSALSAAPPPRGPRFQPLSPLLADWRVQAARGGHATRFPTGGGCKGRCGGGWLEVKLRGTA